MGTTGTVTEQFGKFVSELEWGNIPPEVLEKARACLLNAYGVGLGSNHLPYAPLACRAVIDMEGEHPGGATIFGDGRKTTASGAALANAVLFHGRTQEDFTWGSTHAGVVIVPVLTALLEAKALPATRLLEALVAGYEVAIALDHAYAGKLTENKFRGTPIFGALGTAAAVARLYGLSAGQTAAALAYAAATTGGNLESQSEGSDEWRYQVGVHGSVGMTAAHLAKAGSLAAARAFEGSAGFARVFARTDCDPAAVTGKLGKDWNIMNVFFKPYPVPAWNQTPVELALRLRAQVADRSLRQVDVRMNPYEINYPGKNSQGPFENATAAKLSIAFSVATTLAHGVPTFDLLLDFRNEKTLRLLGKIRLVAEPAVPRLCCGITLHCEDGSVIEDYLAKTGADYSFGCAETSRLVRGIGRETGVPEEAYDRLDDFVRKLPRGGAIQEVIDSFALMPKMTGA